MRHVLLLFTAAMLLVPAKAALADCAPNCVQRSYQGRCLNWGADFCAPGPGVACIPWCVQRTFQGRCRNFGQDFCGYYPVCVPRCAQPGINGRCLNWAADFCSST